MNRYSKIVTPITLFAAVWAILFFGGRYMLYLQEQLQLFQNDWTYFIDNCKYNAGFAQMVSEFVVQFFHIPWLGSMILAAIITATIYAFKSILQLFGAGRFVALIAAIAPMIPLIYTLIVGEGTFSITQFCISIILILPLLKLSSQYRWIVTLITSPILFWLVGAPAILLPIYALLLAIYEKKGRNNIIFSTIPLVTYITFGYIGIKSGLIGSFDWFMNYISPKPLIHDLRYYEPMVVVGWYITPIIIIVFTYFRSAIWSIISTIVIIVGIITTLIFIPNHIYSVGINFKTFNNWAKLHYLYTQGQYDNLLKIYKAQEPLSVVESNYINLSLIQQDKLVTDFFKYNPFSHLSLLMTWTDAPIPTAYIWSEVCRHIGFIYKSGQTAYEGQMLSGPRGSSIFTKLMTESEIVMGNYQIAESYINILENTIFYKEWATQQRAFLNDKNVMADAYYSSKRKCLYKTNQILRNTNELEMLLNIIYKNPSHKISYDFAGIMAMSAGRLKAFTQVIDAGSLTGKHIAPYSSTFQQGLIMAYQQFPILYTGYKIEPKLIENYKEFQKAISDNQSNSLNAKAIIEKNKNTLWNYIYSMSRGRASEQIAPQISQELPNN